MRRMLLIVAMALIVVGCGGPPAAVAPQGPTAAQVAESADLEKQKQAISEQREALKKEREAFRTEQQQAEAGRTAKLNEIQAAAANFREAVKNEEDKKRIEDAAFAEAEAKRKYQEDLVRLGSLKPGEKLWVQSAAAMFKRGEANTEQLQMLLQFNEYRDAVIEELARRGAGAGVLTKPPESRPADTRPSKAAKEAIEEMNKSK